MKILYVLALIFTIYLLSVDSPTPEPKPDDPNKIYCGSCRKAVK